MKEKMERKTLGLVHLYAWSRDREGMIRSNWFPLVPWYTDFQLHNEKGEHFVVCKAEPHQRYCSRNTHAVGSAK